MTPKYLEEFQEKSFLTGLNAIVYVYLLLQNVHVHVCLRNQPIKDN